MKSNNWGEFRKCEEEFYKKGRIVWMIRANFSRDRIELQWTIEKMRYSPSQQVVVPSPRSMLSRDRSMPLDTWNLFWDTGKRFWQSTSHVRFIADALSRNSFTQTNQSATGGIPVQRSTGRLVARGEEQIGSTIPMPMFAGFLPAEIQQNSIAVQQRLQISELQFDNFTTPSTFSCWKMRFNTPGEFLFTIFPRRPCCGSKKWRWTIQWMN